jgi:major membrane immunogen (membrane-anchored lipoprotein)
MKFNDIEKAQKVKQRNQNKQQKQLNEAKEGRKVLTHLTHIEDIVLDHGFDGVETALAFIEQVRKVLAKGEGPVKKGVSVKVDGCVHPDTILLTEEGEMTIQQIIDANRPINVLTHNLDTNEGEYNLAIDPRANNKGKNWIEIEMENGSIIRLTEDHEVYVNGKGWIEAKNLKEDDDILEYKKG